MNPPLYIKYEADNRKYLYDVATGQFLGVSDGIWAIIDDYRRLPLEEIISKHSNLSEKVIQDAWQELEESRINESILVDHTPSKATRIGGIVFNKESFSLDEFLKKFSAMIILGITERCNLRCEYCCYNGHFGGFRTHANRSMSLEIAQKAIHDHIHSRQKDRFCAVSFYGGEPLLEFDLLKQAVSYAENECAKVGKKLHLNMTTNGTLLDDEIIHYLVKHQFIVLISLDGPKEAHDRYRIFAGEGHRGSFDIVMKNLRRFAELYPDYRYRGLSMTLVPPFSWEETEVLFQELYPQYPGCRVSIVNPGTNNLANIDRKCLSSSDCKYEAPSCAEHRYQFLDEEDRKILSNQYKRFLHELETTSLEELTDKMPLHRMLFASPLRSIHERLVTTKPLPWIFTVPCVPGYARRFCDVDGNYHVCERVNSSSRFVIGNVWEGIDTKKVRKLLDWYNRVTNCSNCSAMKTCDLCFAAMSHTDESDEKAAACFYEQCIPVQNGTERLLSCYTSVMNSNSKAFDSNLSQKKETQSQLSFIPDNNIQNS